MPIIANCSGSTGCGRSWTGTTQAHCSICHEHFSTVANFDKHKPGKRKRDGSPGCGKPGQLTRTKRDGAKVPILKAVPTAYGQLWVGWSEDERYTDEEVAS